MSESKASALVLKHIKDAALKLFGANGRHFIATTPQSNPVLPEHIDLLTDFDPDKFIDAEAIATMAELSRLLDYVQDGDSVFSGAAQSPDNLSDQYLSIIKNVEFARANPDDDSREKYELALRKLYSDSEPPYITKTYEYQEFVSLRTKIERDKIARNELVLRLNAENNTDSVIQEISEDIQQYDDSIAAQERFLNALDREHDFTRTEALLEASRVAGFPKSFENVAGMFDIIYRVGDPTSGTTYVRCEFSPNHLSEQNWAPIMITEDEIGAFSRTGETPQSIAAPIRAAEQLTDEDIESVEFEIQTLSLIRPWLWDGLFENKLWRWRVDDSPISDGTGSPQGKIPAYVVGMVFVRNLKVKGKQNLLRQTDSAVSGRMSTNLRLGNFVFSTQKTGPKFARTLRGVQDSSQTTQVVRAGAPAAGGHMAITNFSAATNLRVTVDKKARAFFKSRQQSKQMGLTGVVRDINRQALEGVAITVEQINGSQKQNMITSRTGRFGFQLRSAEKYNITASKKRLC